MLAKTEEAVTNQVTAAVRPIEFVTENGFSILRRWEIERVPPPAGRTFTFLARHEQSPDQEIVVEIADATLEQLCFRTRLRIFACTSFWICCAERHLAIYFWERNDFPPGNKLMVQHLDPEEVILAARWDIE